MKLLEYEAKDILRKAAIPVPKASLIQSADTTCELPVVLKSQVPVGGRGKAGGIKLVENKNDLGPAITLLLSLPIKKFIPKVILAEEKLLIQHEYYLSVIIDKAQGHVYLLAHKNGGVEVEANDTKSFLKIALDSKSTETAGEQLAEYFELPGQLLSLQDMIGRLYHCFIKNDMTLLEINPLIYTSDHKLVAGDCKMELDDAAIFRHPEWQFETALVDNNFVTLDPKGYIATIANGAGLAMATVDAVAARGMTPANFLDIGGGATTDTILAAFQKIMEFPHIRGIVINIFAGITRCDEVARAIIAATKQIKGLPPLFIRLAGTNFEEAAELLAAADITTLPTLDQCLNAAAETSHA